MAFSQEIKIGAEIGGFGNSSDSSIGVGGFFAIDPYGWMAFQADGAYGSVSGESFWYVSPAIVGYPLNYEEFKFGIIGGAGFYDQPLVATRFGLNIGATGDFNVLPNFSIGSQARYHWVFDAPNMWTVFITAAFKFEVDGGW